MAFKSMALLSRPLPSSRISISTFAPECAAERWIRPVLRLPMTFPLIRKFYAVVDTIPYEMNEGVAQLFNDCLVQFCLFTFAGQFDFFAEVTGKITDKPCELAEVVPMGSIRIFKALSLSSAVNRSTSSAMRASSASSCVLDF